MEQKEVQKQVSRDLHDEKFENAYELTVFPKYFSNPIAMIDKALADLKEQFAKTERPYIAKQIIVDLFISQKFKEIANYEVAETNPLVELAKNYTEFKTSKKGGLKDYRFLRILKDLNALPEEQKHLRHLVMERMIYYQMELQKTDFTSLDVLIELLKCWNPDWDTSQVDFDRNTRALAVSGKNLKKLKAKARHSSKVCFFRLIKLKSLSVRGTSVESMDQFIGINVQELDIRDTPLNKIPDYRALTDVARLYIYKGQFEKLEIRKAPDSTEIIKLPLN